MADLVTFDAYLRYVRWQSAPAEAHAVRAWLAQPAHAALAHGWMQQYNQLSAPEASAAHPIPDFKVMETRLLARLQLAPVGPVPRQASTSGLPRTACRFPFLFQPHEFLGLRAFFHRLHCQ